MTGIEKIMTRKINILFLTDVFRMMAGSERNIVNLLRQSDRNQFEIIVACFKFGPLAKSMITEGYTIHNIMEGRFFSWLTFRNILNLKEIIEKNNISLIVAYHESSDFYGLILSKVCKVPIISNRRDMGFQTQWKHNLAYRALGRYFDLNIVVCKAVQEEMERRNWFRGNKIKCIYNGVDTNLFKGNLSGTEAKKAIGIPEGNPVVGLVANLRKVKGVRYFVEAASIIHRRRKEVQFIVIGEDMNEPGYRTEELQQLAEELQVSDQIAFLGKRDDVNELMEVIDVGVLPSLSEGFSNVILEFMACRKPVVATDVGGNRESVVHGESGFLVPPQNAVELAEAILRLLQDEEMRKKFGDAARARVEKGFGIRQMVEEYQKAFLSVIFSAK